MCSALMAVFVNRFHVAGLFGEALVTSPARLRCRQGTRCLFGAWIRLASINPSVIEEVFAQTASLWSTPSRVR